MIGKIEVVLLWVSLLAYVGSFCTLLIALVSQKPRAERRAIRLLLAGFACHTAATAARWVGAGHMPVTDAYELNLTGTWFTVLTFLFFERLRKIDRTIGLVLLPVTFLILCYVIGARTEAVPMGPAFRSPWLIVHVVFAWMAFGSFVISAGAAGLLLLRRRLATWPPMQRVPDDNALDTTSYRLIVVGFINHAIMLVSGAMWAKQLWGYYWNWDPLETWSLLTFIFYAFYLHARRFLGWKLGRAAWLAALGLLILSISFWGIEWFSPGMHPGP